MIFTPLILLMGFVYNTYYYDEVGAQSGSVWYSENDFSDTDFQHIFPNAYDYMTYNDVYATNVDEEMYVKLNHVDVNSDYNPYTYYCYEHSVYNWQEGVGNRTDNVWHDFGFVYYDDTKTGALRYVNMGNFIQAHDNGIFRDANDNVLGIEIFVENTSLHERSNIRLTPFAYFFNTSDEIIYVEGDYSYDFSYTSNILEGNRYSRIYFPVNSTLYYYSLGWKIEILDQRSVALVDEQIAYNSGFSDGKIYGYNEGYTNGYERGEEIGSENGYDTGVADGYVDGYGDGYDVGETNGYRNGYATGYNEGLALGGNPYTFGNLFKSIIDTPIWFLQSLFGFSFFGGGTTLLIVLTSLITICLIIMAIKKVF